jgi:hypothetical protein
VIIYEGLTVSKLNNGSFSQVLRSVICKEPNLCLFIALLRHLRGLKPSQMVCYIQGYNDMFEGTLLFRHSHGVNEQNELSVPLTSVGELQSM